MKKYAFLVIFLSPLFCLAATYPQIEHMKDAPAPLSLEMNLDCFSGDVLSGTMKRSGKIECDLYREIIRKGNFFKAVVEGENEFLREEQITARVDTAMLPKEGDMFIPSEREVQIRWRVWGLKGLLLDETKVFKYTAKHDVSPEMFKDWKLKTVEDVYTQLAAKK